MAKLSAEGRIAANRFGLGLRPDALAAIAPDPRGWLREQVRAPYTPPKLFAKLPHSGDLLSKFIAANKQKDKDKSKSMRRAAKAGFTQEVALRMLHAVQTDKPFLERLVQFWGNHFSVSVKNAQLNNTIAGYEREAIRPHVTNGTFADMLIAVAQHPAMLMYLDNAGSISPDSKAGKRRKKGLNENLAREILELHTLGVNGGYSQADVIALARLITGWSIDQQTGRFTFRAPAHDPNDVTLLGKTYPAASTPKAMQARGEQALRDIASMQATAEFLAAKLARHFISDTPSAQSIETLAFVYLRNHGDLKAMYYALIDLPEIWAQEQTKFKSASDLILSAARLANAWEDFPPSYFEMSFRELGNSPFSADSPAGFPDTAAELLGSDVIMRRISWAPYAARQLVTEDRSIAPDSAAHIALGDSLKLVTNNTIINTEERRQAYAYLFASPEFQRR